jgi:PIN domain nuclease of toxin-antitoxin system
VNFSEVIERLCAGGLDEAEADEAIAELNLQVVDFSEAHARIAARFRPFTRRADLSLGDRACLALGRQLGCPVVTADRAWANLDLGVEVILIR